jgi:hypothetical protein
MPAIPALGRLRQKDCMFEASLGHIVRLSKKKKERRGEQQKWLVEVWLSGRALAYQCTKP